MINSVHEATGTHTVISREDVCAQVCYTKGISWDTIATPEQVREFDITEQKLRKRGQIEEASKQETKLEALRK